MLSKNKIKYINSLKQKKYRDLHNCFVAEGSKIILDLLASGVEIELLVVNKQSVDKYTIPTTNIELFIVEDADIDKVTVLNSLPDSVAVFKKKSGKFCFERLEKELVLFLDSVQDPGNLGTIIRTADWFGIKAVCCSMTTADVYNQKVIQATMGAIGRVEVYYFDSNLFFNEIPSGAAIYGTFLEGENVYNLPLSHNGVIVMGNEGNGISEQTAKWVNSKLFIPHFPHDRKNSESLNVAMATGIVLSEFRRR
ncbi:MAG: RNA methyltransferase [Bacteroidales bacterium]|nr:RNA methyltransferase [Bacteroidales bacterium]